MGRKNIKVDEETFEALKERKPSGVTWDYWFRMAVLGETDEATERMLEQTEQNALQRIAEDDDNSEDMQRAAKKELDEVLEDD